jgi:hypothetical protein
LNNRQISLEAGLILSFNLIAIGLSDLNHAIERRTFDEQFHGLVVSLPRSLSQLSPRKDNSISASSLVIAIRAIGCCCFANP